MTGTDLDRAARGDIAEVLVRYATGIDRRDWTLFRTCFTDDCDADYGDIGTLHSARRDHRVDGTQRTSCAGTRCTASRT